MEVTPPYLTSRGCEREMKDAPEKVFRPSKKSILFFSAIPVGSLILSVVYILSDPYTWVALFFYAFTLLRIGGLYELMTTKLVLYPSSIHFAHEFKKRIIGKKEIERVTWEKGCGASLLLKDGTWIKIPTPGTTNMGICNTIRAWLKRS